MQIVDKVVERLDQLLDKKLDEKLGLFKATIDKRFGGIETNIDQLLVRSINLEEKIDLCATKDELHASTELILLRMDSFAKTQETFDVELVAMRSKYDRLDGRLETVERIISAR